MSEHQPTMPTQVAERDRTWTNLGRIAQAHLIMLRDAGILDDAALAATLDPLDQTRHGAPPTDAATLAELIAAFDLRVDALAPVAVAGVASVGRARPEMAATLVRMALRDELAGLTRVAITAQAFLLDYAATHLVTLMPAFLDGQPAQPTTLAHFLGGLISPLGRLIARMSPAMDATDRSPMGAVALSSSGLPIERERIAELLGFSGPIVNTYDAIGAADHVAAISGITFDIAVTIDRFIGELLTCLRTDPLSIRDGGQASHDPALPQMQPPSALVALTEQGARVRAAATDARDRAYQVDYAPSTAMFDGLLSSGVAALREASALLDGLRDLLANQIEINIAYLANRSGKGLNTASDLATFFLAEESVPPAGARDLAAMVTRRAREQGLEASHISADMIDAAALLTIGRELGIEIEGLNRYLAPRRFIERRQATGAPSPTATRAWLDHERLKLASAERLHDAPVSRFASAEAALDRLVAEARETSEQ